MLSSRKIQPCHPEWSEAESNFFRSGSQMRSAPFDPRYARISATLRMTRTKKAPSNAMAGSQRKTLSNLNGRIISAPTMLFFFRRGGFSCPPADFHQNKSRGHRDPPLQCYLQFCVGGDVLDAPQRFDVIYSGDS